MAQEVVNWVDWFSAKATEADHLERTRRAMELAGMRTDPDTVIEVARFILNDPRAPSKLRKLADVWERMEDADESKRLAKKA